MTTTPACRFCATPLTHTFVDLGPTPLANAYVTPEDVAAGRDKAFSLHARVCSNCFLVQVDDSVPPDAIFSDYLYFSSYSDSWVEHARQYAVGVKHGLATALSLLMGTSRRAAPVVEPLREEPHS